MNGQAKIDFEKWYYKKIHYVGLMDIEETPKTYLNALMIDFFDSVGISIEISRHWCPNEKSVRMFMFGVYIMKNRTFSSKANCFDSDFETRTEATEQAINKAVEIYNNLK